MDDGNAPKKKSSTGPTLVVILGSLLLICAVVGGGLYWVYHTAQEAIDARGQPPENTNMNFRIHKPTYDRVKVNMTRAQADQILGDVGKAVAPDDLPNYFAPADQGKVAEWRPRAAEHRVIMWRNNDDFVLVCFHPSADAGGKVQAKVWEPKAGRPAADGSPDDQVYLEKFSKLDPNAGTDPSSSGK